MSYDRDIKTESNVTRPPYYTTINCTVEDRTHSSIRQKRNNMLQSCLCVVVHTTRDIDILFPLTPLPPSLDRLVLQGYKKHKQTKNGKTSLRRTQPSSNVVVSSCGDLSGLGSVMRRIMSLSSRLWYVR